MRIIRLDEQSKQNILADLLKRDPNNYTAYEDTVHDIVNDVRERRDEAVFEYTKKFDGADLNAATVRVTEDPGSPLPGGTGPSHGDEARHEEYPGVS